MYFLGPRPSFRRPNLVDGKYMRGGGTGHVPPVILAGAMIPNKWAADDHTVPDKCGIRQKLRESTPHHMEKTEAGL